MKTCLGIDPSTHTGLALVREDGEVLHASEVKYPKGFKDLQRAVAITDGVIAVIKDCKPDIICTEGYALHAKFNLATMVELGTVLRLALQMSGWGYYEAAPTALKKYVSGKGNCKKDMMLLECYKRFGFETDNDNIADAVGLAHIGLAKEGVGASLPKANMEALAKVAFIESEISCI